MQDGDAEAFASKIQIHTKFVPDASVLDSIDERYVRTVVTRSLNRLNVKALDLVQFHWWDYSIERYALNTLSKHICSNKKFFIRYVDAAKHLATLKQEGLIRNIGVTNFDAERLQPIVKAGVPIISNQVSSGSCQYY